MDSLYEKLNDIKRTGGSVEAYNKGIEVIYSKIYTRIVNAECMELEHFEDNYPIEVKKIIVEFLNFDNMWGLAGVTPDEQIRDIQNSINKALEVLEKYKTKEYDCLRENGFYNPFKEREAYNRYSEKNFYMEYRKKFKNDLVMVGLSKNKANGIERIIQKACERCRLFD